MGNYKQININIPKAVLKELDELYPKKHTNRNAAIMYAIGKLIDELKEA